jgi:hypothetical protein
MFKLQGRRVFAVAVAVAALTGCGGPVEAGVETEEGGVMSMSESISVVSGYDIRLPATGPYTLSGYVMPRWTAPANHSANDWLALAVVGSDVTQFVAWQYVGAAGLTSGRGDQFTIPASSNTGVQYEVRYFIDDSYTLGAKTPAFSVQGVPSSACGTTLNLAALPTVHFINVGATAGTVDYTFNMQGVSDRHLVYSGATLLYDTGCTPSSGTVSIPFTNANSRLRVVTQPSCDSSSSTGHSYVASCAY